MLWLTYRLFRVQWLIALGALVAVGVALVATGPGLVHLYDTTVAPCAAHHDCPAATTALAAKDHLLQQLGPVVLVLPAVVGMFWGGPLVARELETGTTKLAWTQSVSRLRWLVTKVVLLGLASVAVAGLLSLMVTWWSSPLDHLTGSPFAQGNFDRRDIAPMGYAALAFGLGVFAGTVIRRTLPAMASTLVGFIAVRFADYEWIRPHIFAPVRAVTAFNAQNPGAGGGVPGGAWILTNQTINAAGRVIGANGGLDAGGNFGFNVTNSGTLVLSDGQSCPSIVPASALHARLSGGPGAGAASRGAGGPPRDLVENIGTYVNECVHRLGIRTVLTYQPPSRYWPLQWCELGISLAVAAALVGLSIWWVRRRLA